MSLIVLAVAIVGGLGWAIWTFRDFTTSPSKTRFIYTDVENALGLIASRSGNRPLTEEEIQRRYISRASAGFREYAKRYDVTAERLARAFNRYPRFYDSLRGLGVELKSMEAGIIEHFRALKAVYPEAYFSPVTYLVGGLRSGGTASMHGALINVDLYGLGEQTDISELPDGGGSLVPTSKIPNLVMHEMIHMQQVLASPVGAAFGGSTLLERSLREGTADFLADLLSGGHVNERAHEYGLAHEKDLWEEFERDMLGEDVKDWMWVRPEREGRPQDLGYFIGYRIAEAYYDRQTDKGRAVAGIIGVMSDPVAFFEMSGYPPWRSR